MKEHDPLPVNLRLLQLEDAAPDAELIQDKLRREGFVLEATLVANRKDFRAALEKAAPDIILSDYALPGFSGLEALELVLESNPLVPFIIVSGTIGEDIAVETLKKGASDYLMKDRLDRLGFSVRRALAEAANKRLRLQAEKDAHEARALVETILENTPFMIFLKEAQELRFVMFNRAGEELLGYDRKELIGKSDMDFFPPEQAAWFIDKDREVLKESGVLDIPEEVIQTAKKGRRVLHTKKICINGPDGASKYLLGISEDITERKRTEEQLRQAQKMESVGRLAGGVAHDFNNLITAINCYAKLVINTLQPEDARREDVLEILAAGDRAAALTRQLLAFSRKQILNPVALSLNEAVENAAKLLRRLIGEDIKLEIKLAPGPCLALLDPGQLDQVLMNLAVNARDAMPGGGGLRVEICRADMPEAWCAGYGLRPGPLLRLSVTDTGTGMPPDVQEHLFEPFYTTKDISKGTGLGLATVYGIVKQSGGAIEVESAPGRGSAFHIYFPQVSGTGTAAGPEDRPSEGGRETILFVEDEESLLKLGRRVLAGYGYCVLTASDGPGALEVLRGHGRPVDLLITDLVLPGMDGGELARRVAGQCPGLRVLYMSGYTGDVMDRHGIAEGMKSFMQKPFSPESLAIKVRLVLDSPADMARA